MPAISFMDGIGKLVRNVNACAVAVSSNVSQQIDSLHAVGSSAQAAARGAIEQGGAIKLFTGAVANANKAADTLGRQALQLASTIDGLANRLTVTVTNFADIEGRENPPIPVRLPVYFLANGKPVETATLNLSERGSLIAIGADRPPEGIQIELKLSELGSVTAKVEGYQPLGMQVKFTRMGADVAEGLRRCRASVLRKDERLKDRLARCRDAIEQAIALGIGSGKITLEAMFDDNYLPIPGTNPLQMRTGYLPFLEEILPSFQEAVLEFDPGIVFCVAVDRNGYLPAHNARFSKPQSTDPIWNYANCRNRRIFDDRTGLTAARNRQDFLTQTYPRDMGGGKLELMKDISTPITVAGRPWGALRMAVQVPTFSPASEEFATSVSPIARPV